MATEALPRSRSLRGNSVYEELKDLLDRLEALRHVFDHMELEDRLLAELLLARKPKLLQTAKRLDEVGVEA